MKRCFMCKKAIREKFKDRILFDVCNDCYEKKINKNETEKKA